MQLEPVHEGTFNGAPVVEAELLLQTLRSGRRVLLVDVRNAEEFREAHLEGSRSIPIHQLVARAPELAPDRSMPIIVVSQRGERAKIAAASLRLAGFPEIATLGGGIDRWLAAGLPIERTSGGSSERRE